MPINSSSIETTLQRPLTISQDLPITTYPNLNISKIFPHKVLYEKHKRRSANINSNNPQCSNTCTNKEGTIFTKLIKKDFMHGVEEPWSNNAGVAILPCVFKDNKYHYLLVKENNPLFSDKHISDYSTITGGLENNDPYKTVINEMMKKLTLMLIIQK